MPEQLSPGGLGAVLFDLDGTLADTAPDLGAALNRLRAERGLAGLPIAAVRPYASMGARGLLLAGFGLTPEDSGYAELRDAFLERYDEALCVRTQLFPGMGELLAALDARGLAWGIVTNKAARFTDRVVEALGLAGRVGCVVSGDTTPHQKPHPGPLLHAAARLGLSPERCCYVGDDLRDVQAARAAGMHSVAVEYGYHGVGNGGPRSWSADAVIARPLELLACL
jgi:N-acetyl-D-muramate 6-phosphate phosphatase